VSAAPPPIDVLGIGNAIVDVLTNTDDAFLARHGLAKGAMTLVDAERAESLYGLMRPEHECSGGSAANTMAGLASLGGRAAYIGKVKDDALGRTFGHDLRTAGVEFAALPATTGPPTARCLIFVTPDAQRTMQTFLGASATLSPADVPTAVVERAEITFLEGYLWDPQPAKQAFLAAARIAHAAKRKVALTLSDPFCVDRHRESFRELVEHHVDYLFANEQEAISLFQVGSLDEALERLRPCCETSVVTRGPRGSIVLAGGRTIEVAPEPAERLVDTTGAGDLYAAGFLHGLSRRLDLETCGRLGSLAAAEVISHFGARPATSLRKLAAERLGGIPR
jgi:sugar/nucleoside kinase (ribokinase family)